MPIIREPHKKNFVVLDKTFLLDKRLSNSAKGLLAIMLSMPDNWAFNQDHLVSLSAKKKTHLVSTLNELKKYGYLIKNKCKDKKGQFIHTYHVYEGGNADEKFR